MTRLPFCWRLTCSRGQPSLQLLPFLAPTTRSARPTAALRRVLGVAAYDMLEEFLRKWRRVRSDSSIPAVRAVRCFLNLFTYSLWVIG